MASRSLKNDQHADAGSLKARDAQAQAGITGLRPLQQDGEPAG